MEGDPKETGRKFEGELEENGTRQRAKRILE